jgi:hypothetical protein
MHGKTAGIRPKVVGSFLGSCTSGSYVYRAALLIFAVGASLTVFLLKKKKKQLQLQKSLVFLELVVFFKRKQQGRPLLWYGAAHM